MDDNTIAIFLSDSLPDKISVNSRLIIHSEFKHAVYQATLVIMPWNPNWEKKIKKIMRVQEINGSTGN